MYAIPWADRELFTLNRYLVDAACIVTDVEQESRQHFEAVLAQERQTIKGSVPCRDSGSPVAEDAIVADLTSAAAAPLAVDLLCAPGPFARGGMHRAE